MGKPDAAEKQAVEIAPQPAAAVTPAAETARTEDGALQSRPAHAAAVQSEPPSWPDEAAESAMVSELRARGETVAPPLSTEAIEETETTPLPPLNELVQKIPADVREVLEDLFRARFVTVKRVPKRALK